MSRALGSAWIASMMVMSLVKMTISFRAHRILCHGLYSYRNAGRHGTERASGVGSCQTYPLAAAYYGTPCAGKSKKDERPDVQGVRNLRQEA